MAASVASIFDAATRGSLEEVEAAIAASKEDATALNAGGRTALSLAAAKGHTKVVNALLAAGAVDSTAAGWTAVHHAAFGGHSEVLSALAAKLGATILAPPESGMAPLLLAATKGDVACLTILLDAAPASVNTVKDQHERTALMLAASGGKAEAVELLVARGAEINAISCDGKTALMWAIVAHRPLTVHALATLGADPNIAAPVGDVIVPGQDREKGETAEDLANAKHGKSPTLRHIARFMNKWREARVAGEPVPEMPPLPWVTHAVDFTKKEEEEAAAAAEKAAMAADEPQIAEVGDADENDIFGDADAAAPPKAAPPKMMIEEVPVGGDEEGDHKAEAEEAHKAIAADADLDELD